MPLLTAPELAAALHVNVKDLYRKAQAGQIPSYKIGKSRRFSLQEVLAVVRDPGPMHGLRRTVGGRR